MAFTQPESDQPTNLRRPRNDRMLFGVAAGIAEFFDLDRTIVRLAFVALALAGGIGVPLYGVALLLIPEEGAERSLAGELIERLGFGVSRDEQAAMQDQTIWNWVRRNTTPADGQLRVSDAERAEVTEALSKHYADGRLDESEIHERVAQALAAKTRIELAATLADLPWSGPAEPQPIVRHRPPLLVFVVVGFLLFGAIAALTPPHVPWLPLVIVVLILSRHQRRRRGLVRMR